ncbi:MAG: hypothetical protein ACOYNC_13475 [Bacteroidales bacterium]
MPLEIRIVKDSEYKEVNDFFNKARNINRRAGKTVRSYDQFCWEFMNGPGGKAIYAAAWEVDEGQEPVMVGIQCMIPLPMVTSDGHRFMTAKGEDSLIDITVLIKYRNTDILRELYILLFEECNQKGIELVWGFNNMYATNKRMGFTIPVKSMYHVLVLKPTQAFKNSALQKHATSPLEKARIALLTGLSYVFSLKRALLYSQKGDYQFNTEMSDNTSLFQRVATPGRLCFLWQDHSYLTWRISENPYPVKYRSYQLLNQGNILQAQVVCSINNNEAFIEQILFDRTLKMSAVYSLIKKVLQSLKQENICMVRYIGFTNNLLNQREMKMIRNLGFVYTRKGEHVSFVKLSDGLKINPENVYLSRLYKQGIN